MDKTCPLLVPPAAVPSSMVALAAKILLVSATIPRTSLMLLTTPTPRVRAHLLKPHILPLTTSLRLAPLQLPRPIRRNLRSQRRARKRPQTLMIQNLTMMIMMTTIATLTLLTAKKSARRPRETRRSKSWERPQLPIVKSPVHLPHQCKPPLPSRWLQ